MKQNLWLYFMYIHFRIGQFISDSVRISERMTITEMKCMEVIQALIQKVLSLEGGQKSEAMMCESYSLQPLWEKYCIS